MEEKYLVGIDPNAKVITMKKNVVPINKILPIYVANKMLILVICCKYYYWTLNLKLNI